MHFGRQAWKPQCFGKHRVPTRKPAVARRPPAPAKRKRVVYLKPAVPAHMVELSSTPSFVAHCACSGLLLFAYTVFVFRRLVNFRRACLPDPRAYLPLPRFVSARF